MQHADDIFDGEYSKIVPFDSRCFDGLFEADPRKLRIFFQVIAAVGWRPVEFVGVPFECRECVVAERRLLEFAFANEQGRFFGESNDIDFVFAVPPLPGLRDRESGMQRPKCCTGEFLEYATDDTVEERPRRPLFVWQV